MTREFCWNCGEDVTEDSPLSKRCWNCEALLDGPQVLHGSSQYDPSNYEVAK